MIKLLLILDIMKVLAQVNIFLYLLSRNSDLILYSNMLLNFDCIVLQNPIQKMLSVEDFPYEKLWLLYFHVLLKGSLRAQIPVVLLEYH